MWVPSLGREGSPGEGNGNPLQHSCLENPHGQRSLAATVHGVAKSQTGLKRLYTYTHTPKPHSCSRPAPTSQACACSIQQPLAMGGGRGAV